MQKILNFHRRLANFLGLLILALMFVIVIDVVGRFFFNKPLQGGVEISQLLLAWILFLPLAYALFRGAHVQVTILLMYLSRRHKLIAETIITILSLGLFGLAIYAGWNYFWESISVGETMAAPIWLPLWLAKLAALLGFLLIFIQLCINLVTNFVQPGEKSH